MCEQFVAWSDESFGIAELWPLAEGLERYGIAGFGWGAAWLADGAIRSHRDVRAFRDDPARDELGRGRTTALLVHLRRPSRLSTIGLADTQPFVDPAGRYVFSHNGDFRRHDAWRARFRAAGRIHGRADTEVGARWLEDAWTDDEPPDRILARVHHTFEGQANLALLVNDGTVHHYAGNRENPVFAFRLGAIRVAATGLYSIDRSIFRFAARGARERAMVSFGTTVSIGPGARVGGRAVTYPASS